MIWFLKVDDKICRKGMTRGTTESAGVRGRDGFFGNEKRADGRWLDQVVGAVG